MIRLIIARHGNTFGPDDVPTRVGGRTDLPLVEKGRAQAAAIGKYLSKNKLIPDAIYSSHLQRTYETARIASEYINAPPSIKQTDIFNEIDYGPDENKTEDAVIARIGAQAIKDWDDEGIVPAGWVSDPQELIGNWHGFADQITATDGARTILVVTSNGIARFAPYITGNFEAFKARHNIKLATGALGILIHENDKWRVEDWNIKP